MDFDDLMPNDSTYFIPREPKEQRLARKQEKAQTLEGLTILQDLLRRWDEKISFYDSVRSIPDEIRVDKEKFAILSGIHSGIVESLEAEKEYIEELISNYGPK